MQIPSGMVLVVDGAYPVGDSYSVGNGAVSVGINSTYKSQLRNRLISRPPVLIHITKWPITNSHAA